jgi:hypothetical protein
VLFSAPDVAKYISENFEPTWVSVRPVPKITIDFGNGKTMTRTVNGNVATYVLTADGSVIDVVPGIYAPSSYISALSSIRDQFNSLKSDSRPLELKLKDYHARALVAANRPENPAALAGSTPSNPAVALEAVTPNSSTPPSPLAVPGLKPIDPASSEELIEALSADTRLNETERRPAIHAYLKKNGLITPDKMKHWLYREVLHADLDDPYLGFDRILSKTYPFDDSGS